MQFFWQHIFNIPLSTTVLPHMVPWAGLLQIHKTQLDWMAKLLWPQQPCSGEEPLFHGQDGIYNPTPE